jgi:hypothetical protein
MQTVTDRTAYRAAVAAIAAKATAKLPECNGRVEKAVALVLSGDVELHADGPATVASSTNPLKVYTLNGHGCACGDYERAPQHLCKHRLAAMLTTRVAELLPAPQAPAEPLCEAPASVNLKVVIQGHETQITLRDTSEDRLLTRLQSLLKRPDIRPLPKPAPRGNWRKNGH